MRAAASLLDWLTTLGIARPGDRLSPVSRSGTRATVRALVSPDGSIRAYAKSPGSARALRAELQARDTVAPRLGVRYPDVLAVDDGPPPWVVVAPLRGRVPRPGGPGFALASSAAGEAVRRLHACAHTDLDPVPLDAAMDARFDAAARRLGNREPALVELARRCWRAQAFTGRARTLCHRDYAPRNWLWDPHEGLGVIDFEHAAADHPWVDLVVLDEAVSGAAEAMVPFVAAYGEDPRATPEYRALMALRGLQTVAWGLDAGDPEYVDAGRTLVRRAAAPA